LRSFNALRRTQISQTDHSNDPRLAQLANWIGQIDGFAGCVLEPASDDASFRRYFRVHEQGKSFIAMDAPPPQEDCVPFVRVAAYLESMGLNAPRVLATDLTRGFLLLTDLGSDQYLNVLQDDPACSSQLYTDAIVALCTVQEKGVAYQSSLAPYDEELLRFELSLFRDWLCDTHLQLKFSATDQSAWQKCCDRLVGNALDQPQVFVHRDFHSRNLMVSEKHNPGILDFQDAVEGPFTYDLVSLLKDCYIDWSPDDVRQWALQYYSAVSRDLRRQVDEALFLRHFDLMGVQRHLKAAGIFCRLTHRDDKSGYLAHVPRTLSYIAALALDYQELDFLGKLIRDRILPAWSSNS